LEYVTKLHGIEGGQSKGVGVDTIERVVDDDSRASVALGDYAEGAEA
jgi:hypothetical protein